MLRSTTLISKRYPSPGECIFCGSKANLTDEHIVPRALSGSGELVFEAASCTICNGYANRTYEQKAWENDFVGVRHMLELKQSKRRRFSERRMPKVAYNAPSVDISQETDFRHTLPAEHYPPLYQYVVHGPAGVLVGEDKSLGVRSLRLGLLHLGKKNITPVRVAISMPMIMGISEMVVAKMAYCYALAERGLDVFDTTELLDLLMGRRDDVFNYVGSPVEDEPLAMLQLHKFYFRKRGDLNTVIVHLFASFGGPKHEVVIGPDKTPSP
ncbi:HNH endonuclease [Rhizobium sp. CG5]|nr:HNH endonuclease [Rhizobium sp. CG5]